MNEDWMTELEIRAGEELERKMERYGRLRLDPTAAQAKRARSALMESAWRARLGTPVQDATATRASATRRPRGPFAGWGARRLGVSFAAAVLAGLLIGTTAFASSRAGGPLYQARVAFEELTLPSDPQARLQAELGLAQVRIGEIAESVARDDPGAVAAAVTAYLATLDDLDESTGGPADRALTAVEFHRNVLQDLLARVPADARAGIENAITRSSAVIERLDAAATPATNGAGAGSGGGTGSNGNGGTGGNGKGNGGTGGTGGTGGGAAGAAGGTGGPGGPGGKPTDQGGKPTDQGGKPSKEPKPAKTPVPANQRPARTPAPAASAGPGGGAPGEQP